MIIIMSPLLLVKYELNVRATSPFFVDYYINEYLPLFWPPLDSEDCAQHVWPPMIFRVRS